MQETEVKQTEYFDDPPTPTEMTDVEVNRVLGWMAKAQAEIDRINRQAEDDIVQIRGRAGGMSEVYEEELGHLARTYEPLFEEYTRRQVEGSKTRSVKYIHGVTGFRKLPASLDIDDETVAEEWSRENLPDAIKITTSILKTPLQAHIETTGEAVPGVTYNPGGDRFYFKAVF